MVVVMVSGMMRWLVEEEVGAATATAVVAALVELFKLMNVSISLLGVRYMLFECGLRVK